MKTKVYLGIAIRLIVLFGAAMAITFVTPLMHEFFGDTLHEHTKHCLETYSGCVNSNEPDPLWDWGSRHYWYWWLMLLLFILSLANFVISIINVIKKNYDTSKW